MVWRYNQRMVLSFLFRRCWVWSFWNKNLIPTHSNAVQLRIWWSGSSETFVTVGIKRVICSQLRSHFWGANVCSCLCVWVIGRQKDLVLVIPMKILTKKTVKLVNKSLKEDFCTSNCIILGVLRFFFFKKAMYAFDRFNSSLILPTNKANSNFSWFVKLAPRHMMLEEVLMRPTNSSQFSTSRTNQKKKKTQSKICEKDLYGAVPVQRWQQYNFPLLCTGPSRGSSLRFPRNPFPLG